MNLSLLPLAVGNLQGRFGSLALIRQPVKKDSLNSNQLYSAKNDFVKSCLYFTEY